MNKERKYITKEQAELIDKYSDLHKKYTYPRLEPITLEQFEQLMFDWNEDAD